MSCKPWKARKFKQILLSENNQTKMSTYCMIPTIWYFEKSKTTETGVPRAWEVGGTEDEQAEYRGLLQQWNYFMWYYNDSYTSLFTKTYRTYNTENGQLNYGLWMIIVQKFTTYKRMKNVSAWRKLMMVREVVRMCKWGLWRTSILCFFSPMNLKLL